jgi:protein-disulfide isomerase
VAPKVAGSRPVILPLISRRRFLVSSLAGSAVASLGFLNRKRLKRLPNSWATFPAKSLDFSPDILDGYLFLGDLSAPIKAVLFVDYRCPTCEGVLEQLPAYYAKHRPEVCFLIRNFPVAESHPDAFEIAVLFEVARQRSCYDEALALKQKLAFEFKPKDLEALLEKQRLVASTEKTRAKATVERDLTMTKRLDLLITPSIVVCHNGVAELLGEFSQLERYF